MNEIVTTNIIGLIHWWGGRASLINSECKEIMIEDYSWPFVIDNSVSDNKEKYWISFIRSIE